MNQPSVSKLTYVRYLFPIVALCLTLLLILIPCYSYTTAETGQQEAISLYVLMDNARIQVCEYLFETTGDRDAAMISFSKIVLGLLVALSVLYVVALASAVYVFVSARRYFADPEARDSARILFITLVPNRIAAFVLQALCFPLLALPHILILLYEKVLHIEVALTLTFVDPLILAAILFVACVVLSAMSASREKALDADPFARPITADADEDEE